MPQEIEIQNVVELEIRGFIDSSYEERCSWRLAEADDSVRVVLSSGGGDYLTALAIYNQLRESGKKVTTSAQGICASAAAVILLAGDSIEASANSIIMFHPPMIANIAGANAEQLTKVTEKLRVMEDVLCKTICERTGWKEDKARNFMQEAKPLTAEDAKSMGIIDKILPFKRKKVEVSDNLPVEILNFVTGVNEKVDLMNLRDILGKLSITVIDNATEEQMIESLVTHVTTQREQMTAQQGRIAELEAELPKKVTLPSGILNILKRSREGEINTLVSLGKITPIVAADLRGMFVNDEHITKFVDADGNVQDQFSEIVNAIGKNESVISFGNKTAANPLPKDKPYENPLLKDAEKRAEAAK